MSTYLRSMETAVNFIEDHLEDDISVADIATAASYSLYHFCRIFNQTVHHSPYDYLMRRRLTCAAHKLLAGRARITDIAFDFQFGSSESFSRAFRRMFQQLPNAWRKQTMHDPRQLMNPITTKHLQQRNGPEFERPFLVQKPAITILGLMTIAQDEQDVTQLRQQFAGSSLCTVYHYPDNWAEQGRPILVGKIEKQAALPFVAQTLPAMEYACFALPELDEERPYLIDYIYQTWLPQSGYKLVAPLEFEEAKLLYVPIEIDG